MSYLTKIVAFERDKLRKQILMYGKNYIFKREQLNEYKEPTGEVDIVSPVFGIYHDTFGGYTSRQIAEGAVVAKNQIPMIVCLLEDAVLLHVDDFVEIGDEKYRIISLNNVNNLNYAVEISLEVLNKDGVQKVFNRCF